MEKYGLAHEEKDSIVLKVIYKSNIKKFILDKRELQIEHIYSIITNTFYVSTDDIVLKYEDEDGDLISIEDNSDVKVALTTQNKLKIHVKSEDDEYRESIIQRRVIVPKISNVKIQIQEILDILCEREGYKHNTSINQENVIKTEVEKDDPLVHTDFAPSLPPKPGKSRL